jgi:hypothetical protein
VADHNTNINEVSLEWVVPVTILRVYRSATRLLIPHGVTKQISSRHPSKVQDQKYWRGVRIEKMLQLHLLDKHQFFAALVPDTNSQVTRVARSHSHAGSIWRPLVTAWTHNSFIHNSDSYYCLDQSTCLYFA